MIPSTNSGKKQATAKAGTASLTKVEAGSRIASASSNSRIGNKPLIDRLSGVERLEFFMDDEKSWDYQINMARGPRGIGQRRTNALLIGMVSFAILAFVIHLIS